MKNVFLAQNLQMQNFWPSLGESLTLELSLDPTLLWGGRGLLVRGGGGGGGGGGLGNP